VFVDGSDRARRTLTTLFVRPAARLELSSTYRFAIPREDAETLPLGLLRLASVVKFGSPHQVAVHDARIEPGGNRALRSVATIFRPDVAVLWLHPATLGDGLEAARAVRQAGCELVLGTGPLVDLWPEGAGRIPELDGLLPSAGSSTILSALDAVASGRGSQELGGVLASVSEARSDLPVDRKLLDYARYRRGTGAPWPWPVRTSVPAGRWKRAFRRRHSIQSVSPVFLHGEDGQPLSPQTVLDDIRGAVLLGIQNFDLVPRPLCLPPGGAWLAEFLPGLRQEDGGAKSPLRLRLAIDPLALDDVPLLDLPTLGVVAVDLGEVTAGDDASLDSVLLAAAACRRQKLEPTGTLVLGRPGYAPDLEVRGLERAVGERFPTAAGLEVRPGTVDAAAWGDWLDAPSPAFEPPGLDPDRIALAQRAREALAQVPPPQPNLRRLAKWVYGMRR